MLNLIRTFLLGTCLAFFHIVSADQLSSNKLVAFSIPAQRADISLTEFAQQADITLIFSFDVAAEVIANRLAGHYQIEEAIRILLKDTDLDISTGEGGQFVVSKKDRFGASSLANKETSLSAVLAGKHGSLSNTSGLVRGESPFTEEVIVKGIRGSLQRAMQIKKNASGVVDSISAEDIGKFPDSNLAESLQRITGVSIDRFNNEGNQVSVRGLGPSFNMVTLNNRQMPKSSTLSGEPINRAFNFQHIAAEVVSGVDVYKTAKAHVDSGGIGATINLKTAKPFDLSGLTLSGVVKGISDQSNVNGRDITPEVSGLFSNVFADERFGLLLAYAHSQRDSRKEAVISDGWIRDTGTVYQGVDASNIDRSRNPDGVFWVPRNFSVEYGDHERTRDNYQVVAQYAPADNLTLTADYTGSRFRENIDRVQNSFWFDSDLNTIGDTDENGTVINPRHADHRLNFAGFRHEIETHNNSFGVNVDWQLSDHFKFMLDVHDSTSRSQPDGTISEFASLISGRTFEVDIGLDIGSNDVPAVIANPTGGQNPYARENTVGDVAVIRGFEVDNNIRQVKASGLWKNQQNGILKNVHFGLVNTEYQFDTNDRFKFNLTPSIDYSELDLSFIPAHVGSEFSGATRLFPFQVEFEPQSLNAIVESDGLLDDEEPVKTNLVSEDTVSGFFTSDLEFRLASFPTKLNIGFRYEKTDVTATAISLAPLALNFIHQEELRPTFEPFANRIPTAKSSHYAQFLPNLDLSVAFSNAVLGRFSYSKTITRSDLSQLSPVANITNTRPGGPFNATQGDPALKPFESNNVDLSLEWYFSEGSYSSLGYFYKNVENFIGTRVDRRSLLSSRGLPLTDPTVNPRPNCPPETDAPMNNPDCLGQEGDPQVIFDVIVPRNLEDTSVEGLEFAVQKMFGQSGFGLVLNYTFVNSAAEYDIYSIDQTIALPGLSDSANVVAFYNKHGVQVRLAYNWRDEFLLQTNQFHSPDEPTFTEEYGQWDMSASFDIDDHFSLVFEAVNLLEETAHRHGRFSNQFLAAEYFGRRFSFGVRAAF